MKKLFIHVGYPKTATTSLQNYLFDGHDEIGYLNKDLKSTSIIKQILYSRENAIERNKAQIYFELKKVVDNYQNYETMVFSNESLLSMSMFFRTEPKPMVFIEDVNSIARKLHKVFCESGLFEEVKIIIAIRRQEDLIKSIYAQVYNRYFKKFKQTSSFKNFISYSLLHKENFVLDALHFENVIFQYEQIFGCRNIGVFVFEDLKLNQRAFITNLSRFLNVDKEISIKLLKGRKINKKSGKHFYKTDTIKLTSNLHKFKKFLFGNLKTGFTNSKVYKFLNKFEFKGQEITNVNLSKEEKIKFKEIYSKGNRILSQRRKLNLDKHNYSC
tara:strand:+ start:87 stop:1070 length:984 start_codon:yes stop_codon:yes gene_type:complete